MRRLRRIALALAVAALLSASSPGVALAQVLVADLSSHLVKVSTGFSGTELLLFGATQDEGDVIVVVRGPDGPATIRRKVRSAVGIWVNSDSFTFEGVPSFYKVASSRPLADLKADDALASHQIGLANLRFRAGAAGTGVASEEFRRALLRNKARLGVFGAKAGAVTFLGENLFRTRVTFPSNVPTGTYTVTVYLLRAGDVVNAQTIPLIVSKIGIGAKVYDFAHRQAAAYGVLAILIALLSGWLASAVFRKT